MRRDFRLVSGNTPANPCKFIPVRDSVGNAIADTVHCIVCQTIAGPCSHIHVWPAPIAPSPPPQLNLFGSACLKPIIWVGESVAPTSSGNATVEADDGERAPAGPAQADARNAVASVTSVRRSNRCFQRRTSCAPISRRIANAHRAFAPHVVAGSQLTVPSWTYVLTQPLPPVGWRGFLGELYYDGPDGTRFQLTTQVRTPGHCASRWYSHRHACVDESGDARHTLDCDVIDQQAPPRSCCSFATSRRLQRNVCALSHQCVGCSPLSSLMCAPVRLPVLHAGVSHPQYLPLPALRWRRVHQRPGVNSSVGPRAPWFRMRRFALPGKKWQLIAREAFTVMPSLARQAVQIRKDITLLWPCVRRHESVDL